ncbi:MAG TPA: hypothetical protein PKE39_04345 [Ignavibacteria bacterium]|nr:hypothetical protein [Ignavibacteria bacterium]HMQ98232.1 hypothetical protein [Ignavibacteria bacterium]
MAAKKHKRLKQLYKSAEDIHDNVVVVYRSDLYTLGNKYHDGVELYTFEDNRFVRTINYGNLIFKFLIKYIILMKVSETNKWYIVAEYDDNGDIVNDNLSFVNEHDARKCAIEIIEFDDEQNEKAEEGENFIIQKILFDPNIVEAE